MITIISIFLLLLCIWLTFKIVPAVLGFAFFIIFAILQIVGIILLLPVLGFACFLLDVVVIGSLVLLIKLFV